MLKQNQFGGVLGGPIVKNTLFAFGFYEGFRNKSGITQTLTVLTDAQRQGNFGSTTVRDPATGVAFPNNTIPASRISPAAAKLLADFMPSPNAGGKVATPFRRPCATTATCSARASTTASTTGTVLAR